MVERNQMFQTKSPWVRSSQVTNHRSLKHEQNRSLGPEFIGKVELNLLFLANHEHVDTQMLVKFKKCRPNYPELWQQNMITYLKSQQHFMHVLSKSHQHFIPFRELP